jgi:hypothetical protein
MLTFALAAMLAVAHGPARAVAGPRVTRTRAVAMSAKKALKPMVADPAAEAKLLGAVAEKKRDMAAIGTLLRDLAGRDGAVRPETLYGGWQLRWVPNAGVLDAVGTGLHNVAGTSFEDFFLSIGTEKSSKCEVNEVLRVFGPFPSVRNVLSGSYAFDPVKGRLRLKYTEMMDGLGKQLKAKDGSSTRVVELEVRYAGEQALIAAIGGEELVFGKVKSIRDELIRLRVLKPASDDEDAK